MDGGNLMDFVSRFRQLQVQRDTSDELIKVSCVPTEPVVVGQPQLAGFVPCLPSRGQVTLGKFWT